MKAFYKIALSLITLGSASLYGGVDPKAKSILDELSKNTKAYKTIAAEVQLTSTGKDKKVSDKQTIKLKLKGKKYRLEIPGNLIVTDGSKVWSKNVESKEITVKDPESESEMNPSNIFNMYEKGYSSKLIRTEKNGKQTNYVIRLIPDNKKKTDSVFVYVDGSKKKINKMEVFKKNQSKETFEIKKFTPNSDMKDTEFVLAPADNKDCTYIDETEGK